MRVGRIAVHVPKLCVPGLEVLRLHEIGNMLEDDYKFDSPAKKSLVHQGQGVQTSFDLSRHHCEWILIPGDSI